MYTSNLLSDNNKMQLYLHLILEDKTDRFSLLGNQLFIECSIRVKSSG